MNKKTITILISTATIIIISIIVIVALLNKKNDKNNNDKSIESVSADIIETVDIILPETRHIPADDDEDYSYSAGMEGAIDLAIDEMGDDYTPDTYWGYTNLGLAHVENHLNIRETPDPEGKLVGKMSNNDGCEILEIVEGQWAHIISGEIEGYCSIDYLLTGPEAIVEAEKIVTPIATVTASALKVRESPNTDCRIITQVPTGEELKVLEIVDDWVKIDLDDEDAYVYYEYVEIEERLTHAISMTELLYGEGVSDVRVDLCQYAKQFVGNPYVWGGTSLTKGADCSGFVMSVYAHYGIKLPHSSRSQANSGTKVDLNNVKPGDLIFYTRGSTINHVALYIGNGQVVHASSPKTGIKISSMYYRTPYKAVSLLN